MRFTLLIALALLTAGCLGGGEPVTVEQTPTVVDDRGGAPGGGAGSSGAGGYGSGSGSGNATVADAPAWAPGAWWTYRFDYGDGGGDVTLAVQRMTRAEYVVLSNSEEMALYDAVLDVSFLGPVSVRDLSGSQHGQAVQFYQWPLEDGATWTTTWDGVQVTVTARAANVTTPGGTAEPGYALTATTADGETHAAYDYAPSVGWWTRMTFGNATDVGMFLQDHGYGYGDALVDAAGEERYATAGDASAHADTFPVGEDATHVVALAGGGGAAFAEAVEFVDPEDNVHGFTTAPCAMCGAFRLEVMDALPGEWRVAVAAGGPPGMAGHLLEAHEVTVTTATVEYA